jgi:hypothetical protein
LRFTYLNQGYGFKVQLKIQNIITAFSLFRLFNYAPPPFPLQKSFLTRSRTPDGIGRKLDENLRRLPPSAVALLATHLGATSPLAPCFAHGSHRRPKHPNAILATPGTSSGFHSRVAPTAIATSLRPRAARAGGAGKPVANRRL